MGITITLTAENHEALLAQVCGIFGVEPKSKVVCAGDAGPQYVAPPIVALAPQAETAPPVAEKKKPGRPAKEKSVETDPLAPPPATPSQQIEAALTPETLAAWDQMDADKVPYDAHTPWEKFTDLCNKLMDAKGVAIGREVISKYGCKATLELKEKPRKRDQVATEIRRILGIS